MNFIELAKKRSSVRAYEDKKIEREKLLQVLEAARVAPSAVNYQPWHFIVLEEEEAKEKVYPTYSRDWIKKAPAIIVACGDHQKAWRRADGKGFADIDVAIALDHMTLEATALGLGTCWICAFDAYQCHKALGLPSHLEVIALLPIGYPLKEGDKERHTTQRKSLEEIISFNQYSKN